MYLKIFILGDIICKMFLHKILKDGFKNLKTIKKDFTLYKQI